MSQYKTIKLRDVADVFSGYAFNATDMNSISGIPLIKIKNVNHKKVSKQCDSFLNVEALKRQFEKFFLRSDDFLIAMTGQGSVGRIGKMRGNSGRYLVNQRVGIIRTKLDLADPEYLYQCLARDEIEQVYFNLAMGAGQPNLSPNDIGNLSIPFPPLRTQQKIADILSAYDDLIENNLKRIKLLEEMAQITYEEWFVRLKFPGHETTPIDSETGLPVGWSEAEISAISFINANSIKAKEAPESIKYIDIASADTGFYQEPQTMSYAEAPSRARRKVNFGDTIFSTVRPNRKTYSLILENDPMLVASTGFAVLTPKIEETFPFVYLTVANQTFVDKAVAVAGGAAYPAINQNDFEKIKIVKPDDALIKLFSEKVINNFTAKHTLTKQNQLLKEARDILLPRLMTGMIDVEQLVLPELFSNMPLTSSQQEPKTE